MFRAVPPFFSWGRSSAGQSAALSRQRSRVQVPSFPSTDSPGRRDRLTGRSEAPPLAMQAPRPAVRTAPAPVPHFHVGAHELRRLVDVEGSAALSPRSVPFGVDVDVVPGVALADLSARRPPRDGSACPGDLAGCDRLRDLRLEAAFETGDER